MDITFRSDEISWDSSFMESAKIFARHSKCAAKKVACILVKNNAIISIGVNGTLSGMENCNERYMKIDGTWFSINSENIPEGPVSIKIRLHKCENQEEHHEWSKNNEVHAEINALGKAARSGISTLGSTAYITHSPCHRCALALVTFGISKVVFWEMYDGEPEAIEILKKANIEIVNMSEIL